MSRRILFVDRDGTIIHEPPDEQVDSFEKVRFVDDAITALHTLQSAGWELVMVTNQDGLGTDSFPEQHFAGPHQLVLDVLESQGVTFSAIHVDRSFEHENEPTRKPGVGMLLGYLPDLDRENSYVIGDRESDEQLGRNLGVDSFRIGPDGHSWKSILESLVGRPRTASIERITNETKIRANINLDASSPVSINTGLGFFDHMIEQIARHAGISLELGCDGDLNVDEHHTIEDCGIVLGSVLSKALGDRRGVGRFGFLLPMDESLAQIALDLSGRPYLVFNASFEREYVGELPTEMVEHFFYSFAQNLGATLNISVDGDNTHHKVEAIFKGVGRALRDAVAREGGTRANEVPSSKGTLTW